MRLTNIILNWIVIVGFGITAYQGLRTVPAIYVFACLAVCLDAAVRISKEREK